MMKSETKERVRAEAIERMKLLRLYTPIIKQFERHGVVFESAPPLGACYDLNSEQLRRIREFEGKNDAVVYHVIHSYTDLGELENYLFVSKHDEEWAYERNYMRDGMVLAYVYNNSMPDCSEMGTIGVVQTPAAGLARAW